MANDREYFWYILAARWRIFRHPIRPDIETVILIVQACVSLYNYLQLTSRCSYTPHGFVDEELSDGSIKKATGEKSSLHRILRSEICVDHAKRA